MDNIHIFFLILVPITMFLSGFLVARQFRSLENVPVFSLMYVKYRFLFSAVMGVIVSLFFTTISAFVTKFSIQQLFMFVALFIVATFSYYYGVTLGWGRSLSVSETTKSSNQTQVNTLPENFTVDNTLTSIKITINTQKRWAWFVMSLVQWVVVGFCVLPILGLMLTSVLQNYLPENLKFIVWIPVGGLILYLLYAKFQEALEYVFDKEIIEIDNLSVRVENFGLGFKSRKEYSAENIKKITILFSLGGSNMVIRRSPFVNANMPAFMIWHSHGLKRFRYFGRALDLADAQSILEKVHSKFPQYKG